MTSHEICAVDERNPDRNTPYDIDDSLPVDTGTPLPIRLLMRLWVVFMFPFLSAVYVSVFGDYVEPDDEIIRDISQDLKLTLRDVLDQPVIVIPTKEKRDFPVTLTE